MSEPLQKVAGVKHLPIFPLPLVMLPNEVLPLHIFEDKYRQMLKDIEADRRLFGISFFDPETALIDRPAAGTVGCVAEVRENELLPDGRSNIVAMGIVRYRLLDYVDAGDPYLVGDLDFFDDDDEDPILLEPLAEEVFVLFKRMAAAAHKMSGSRGELPEIHHTDPASLSFLITAAFNFENDKKYQLLELTSTLKRLQELKEILDQAVVQIEEGAEIQAISRTNGHSKKKIKL
jgi:Lon protease-like protein